MSTTARARSYWGWGHEQAALDGAARDKLRTLLALRMDVSGLEPLEPRPIGEIDLPRARLGAPAALGSIVSQTPAVRAAHTYGKAFRDLVRALQGDFASAPDLVAFPRHEQDVVDVLGWCSEQSVAAIPFGGGSSVVGGVEARVGDAFRGVVSIDVTHMCGVREIDVTSRAALIDAGTFGPALEAELAPHGLSLRHYPQSFEFSTLGGWLATRAGGHFATLYTHIDDMVESLAVVTPSGFIESRRLPASGAGPSPDRMFLGSEGALGIIVRAWMRLQQRPRFRSSVAMRFGDLYAGAGAARRLAQAGLYPANCRLLDPDEALIAGVGDGSSAFLLVAFESADHELDAWMQRAREICHAAGGEAVDRESLGAGALPTGELGGGEQGDAVERWRRVFLRAPYIRDALVRLGTITDTFETAITWDQFEPFHRAVMQAATAAVKRICGSGIVSSRLTHVYPDGAAPYFTVVAPARGGSQVSQSDELKAAVSEAILSGGGTITHHHAIGRDHRQWYDQQRPEPFSEALAAAKRALDPAGVLNPGVLVG